MENAYQLAEDKIRNTAYEETYDLFEKIRKEIPEGITTEDKGILLVVLRENMIHGIMHAYEEAMESLRIARDTSAS